MNPFDKLLGSRGGEYKRPLLELEGVIGAWTAARMRGVSLAGGEIVLARDHLVFSPWDMDKTRAFLVQWLSKAGVPHVGTADKLLTASKLLEPVVLPVADIERVEMLNRASVLNPLRSACTCAPVGTSTLAFFTRLRRYQAVRRITPRSITSSPSSPSR